MPAPVTRITRCWRPVCGRALTISQTWRPTYTPLRESSARGEKLVRGGDREIQRRLSRPRDCGSPLDGNDPVPDVFARWAIDRLDTASSIRVLDADNAEVRGYRFAVLFSPETFFEELGAIPYFVKDARVVSGKPLETEMEWIRFPEPIGLQKTYAVAHEEGVSLGIYPPFCRRGSLFRFQIQPFGQGG